MNLIFYHLKFLLNLSITIHFSAVRKLCIISREFVILKAIASVHQSFCHLIDPCESWICIRGCWKGDGRSYWCLTLRMCYNCPEIIFSGHRDYKQSREDYYLHLFPCLIYYYYWAYWRSVCPFDIEWFTITLHLSAILVLSLL